MKCITNFELLLQKEQEVDVGQAMLLELYCEDKPLDMTKHASFYIIEHCLYLLNKDMCHNVGAV